MATAITALLSIFGVVVGALLQNHFARQSHQEKHLLESRNAAYIDFLEAVSELVAAQRVGNKQREIEQLARLTHAKARICIFGEEHVVRRLATFWAAGATLETEQEILAFTRFCMEIRKSLGIKDKEFLHSEVSQLLFAVNPARS
ncbi:hypothetical protein [Xanthomonas vesicatoria]|uniref:hypothetical protein n=1 Tax=Xanthomonas vesicatoria TaxID=56460 RepID=UPI001E4ED560|nr:hypothetical protein [Xanthomonas vesicatoria]MCC8556759.1 hypothetical protein [Xanthomonas vesicatoria]MCC8600699.1 hypothetical protein [Xanthomonas vesicatoria]MCC8610273.1 hypothetical protein [Xanthomonas vesicatoria]MCC8672614.1 hypothetical protein [Xanthomonas vesicatoria]MCC8680004.1 hypothetical protein [Xanthomonas vesicatoria]